MYADWSLRFRNKLCVPKDSELNRDVIMEVHNSPYYVHPKSTKMYLGLKKIYWWPNMKKEKAWFVEQCLNCQYVKEKHYRPFGLLKPLLVPKWKLTHIIMDFVLRMLRTQKCHDSLWVIMDRLTKFTHFLPMNMFWMVHVI